MEQVTWKNWTTGLQRIRGDTPALLAKAVGRVSFFPNAVSAEQCGAERWFTPWLSLRGVMGPRSHSALKDFIPLDRNERGQRACGQQQSEGTLAQPGLSGWRASWRRDLLVPRTPPILPAGDTAESPACCFLLDSHPCYPLSYLYSQKASENTTKACVYLCRKAEYKKKN